MKQYLYIVLTGLVACGGSQAGEDSLPAREGGGATTTDEGGPAETSSATNDDAGKEDDGGEKKDAGEFDIKDADKSSRPTQAKLEATETEAAVRFFVVDKKKGPIEGLVISLTSPEGKKYYTEETDAEGFTELLLPIGRTYELVYLSLGRSDVAARVKVADKPNLNLKLTMRYEREELPTGGLLLDGVEFQTGKATLTTASYARLDEVVEFMKHKKSARVEISGHTDNVGNKRANKRLSQKRANAVRDYLVSEGIDASRIDAVGHGDKYPIASNDTPEGRQKNRRIEAVEK